MKIYRTSIKSKIYSFGILLFFLIIPLFLNVPLLGLYTTYDTQGYEEKDVNNDKPITNAPPNAINFQYYKTITIDHNKVAGSGSYSNFPVLINITDSDLRFDVQSDGDDIAFSFENNWLDHEIELFDQTFSPTHAHLIAWIRVPELSGVIDTIIRMYYGNSTMNSQQNPIGVWDSNYRGVWHLNEGSGGANSIIDSTSNSNDGTDVNNPNLGQIGQIFNSVGFTDSSAQRIEVSDDTSLDISNELTVEAWIKPNVDTKWMTIVSKMDGVWGGGSVADFDIYVAINDLGNYDIGLSNPSNFYDEWDSSIPISTGTWQHFVFAYQGSTSMGRIFVNGAYIAGHDFGIGTLGTNGNPFYIGFNRAWTGEVFDGLIDEVRISSRPRSSGWINTEYQNQYDPDSFYLIGSEQIVTSEPPNVDYFTFYKIITIDATKVAGTGSHMNFPVLISIIDEDLKYHCQPDGNDIAFSMGGDWLNHEIELFNQSYSSTQAQLIVWIRIPLLSTSVNTIFTMYYGNTTMTSQENPSGVWNNFIGVWHLNDNPAGIIYDSTAYSNDGITLGFMSPSDLVSCQISTGFELDGIDDMISIPESSSLDSVSDEGTLSLWINWVNSSDGGYQRIMTTSNRFTANPTPPPTLFQTDGFEWAVQPDGDHFFYPYGGVSTNYNLATDPFTNNIWHYLVVTLNYATKSVNIYLDGISLSFTIENVPSQWIQLANLDDWLWGGNTVASGSQFLGKFDEIRVSNVERTLSWILTEYNNQFNPNSFYSISVEQLVKDQPENADYFKFFKIITIDHTKVNGTGSHINFPLLISLLDEDLRYDVQNDGDDIAFSMDGKWLDHQIEHFNISYSGTHARLVAWIRIPFLSTAFDTNVSMYYSNFTMSSRQNPSQVWNSGYVGVWHLNEDPSGTPPQMKDSATPSTDGSSYGSMTSSDRITGKIGNAIDFDGINDYISIINNPELQITGELTVQIWFKADIIQNDYLFNKMGSIPASYGWDISFDDITTTEGYTTFRFSNGISTQEVGYEPIKNGSWYHAVGVFKPNEYAKFFINGTLVGLLTTGIGPSLQDPPIAVVLGRRSQGITPYYNGIIDEARISNVARSNDWIATEYNNQYDPSSFYSIGSELPLTGMVDLEA
ncbi:MAG: DUF2341 domain-containing protein, partial [Candidatus Thorarchaeota archaeon]